MGTAAVRPAGMSYMPKPDVTYLRARSRLAYANRGTTEGRRHRRTIFAHCAAPRRSGMRVWGTPALPVPPSAAPHMFGLGRPRQLRFLQRPLELTACLTFRSC